MSVAILAQASANSAPPFAHPPFPGGASSGNWRCSRSVGRSEPRTRTAHRGQEHPVLVQSVTRPVLAHTFKKIRKVLASCAHQKHSKQEGKVNCSGSFLVSPRQASFSNRLSVRVRVASLLSSVAALDTHFATREHSVVSQTKEKIHIHIMCSRACGAPLGILVGPT